jgi:hypothetical protein
MPITVRLILFSILSLAAAYLIDRFGFALAHSLEWGGLAFLFSPGIFVIFFHEDLGTPLSWVVLVLVNICYYELIYRLASWKWKSVPR